MGFPDTTTRKLRAKLNGDNIRTREWNGKTLSYIEGWHALSEANRIFGFDGWNRETVDLRCIVETGPRAQHPHCAYIAKVRISVLAGEEQVVREGTGAGYTAAGSLAEAHALAAKEAETDATKRALATFGNPFGLALYDREQKNVRRAKAPAAKPVLWEVRDKVGIVTGKYADPATCATSLIIAFEAADTVEVLQGLWAHNEALVAELQAKLAYGDKGNGRKPTNGNGRATGNGNGGNIPNPIGRHPVDLLAAYQKRYTKLRDMEPSGLEAGAGGSQALGDADVSADRGSDDSGPEALDQVPADIAVQNTGKDPVSKSDDTEQAIDKSALTIGAPKRIRAPEHLKWVASLPCLICQRQPSDAHHLKRVQPNALGRKPGDQWVVPLCRIHHRALHDAGDETRWWEIHKLDQVTVAEELWANHIGRSTSHAQRDHQSL